MPAAVLDSSAILAVIFAEPGSAVAQAAMADGVVSAVNHSEVVGRLIDKSWTLEDIADVVGRLTYTIVPFDADLAVAAGLLRPATRSFGLSLGDRACLALARREGLRVVTADRTWAKLDVGVAIDLMR